MFLETASCSIYNLHAQNKQLFTLSKNTYPSKVTSYNSTKNVLYQKSFTLNFLKLEAANFLIADPTVDAFLEIFLTEIFWKDICNLIKTQVVFEIFFHSIGSNLTNPLKSTLRQKCPYTEFFLVRIFPYSHWITRDTPYLSVFSWNAVKYGPEKNPYLDTFHVVWLLHFTWYFVR